MSKHTNIVFSTEARQQLLIGLNKTAEAVGSTLGPNGQTVLIKKGNKNPIVTKDGVTVCNSITLKDPLERIGSMLLQEAASRTNEVAGDGTTTATILTQAFVQNCVEYLAHDLSPNNLTLGVQAATKCVIDNLNRQTQKIKDINEIKHIGTISANGDTNIGEIIATAMKSVGHDGIITVEDAKGMETNVEIVEGIRFDRGYLSPYFINNKDKMEVQYSNCNILITDKTLNDMHELIPILEVVSKAGKGLLIIAPEVEGTALSGLVLNATKSGLKVVAIKAPGWGDYRHDLLEDLCIATGAKLVSSKTGVELQKLKLEDLGKSANVVVNRTSTTIVGPKGDEQKLNEHIATLRAQMMDVTISIDVKDKIKARLAGLTSGAAIIKVGGVTELDLIEKKHRIEDALNSTRAAAEEGIIAGGGIVLYTLSNRIGASTWKLLPEDIKEDEKASFNAGVKIVLDACKAPLTRILKNGEQYDTVIKSERFLEITDPLLTSKITLGFNARNNEFVDMYETGVIDPVKVTKCALENASSVAQTFLSLKAVVYEEDDKQ